MKNFYQNSRVFLGWLSSIFIEILSARSELYQSDSKSSQQHHLERY